MNSIISRGGGEERREGNPKLFRRESACFSAFWTLPLSQSFPRGTNLRLNGVLWNVSEKRMGGEGTSVAPVSRLVMEKFLSKVEMTQFWMEYRLAFWSRIRFSIIFPCQDFFDCQIESNVFSQNPNWRKNNNEKNSYFRSKIQVLKIQEKA